MQSTTNDETNEPAEERHSPNFFMDEADEPAEERHSPNLSMDEYRTVLVEVEEILYAK